MKIPAILVINAGSSSIKFSLFSHETTLPLLYHGEIQAILENPILTILDAQHKSVVKKTIHSTGFNTALEDFFNWLENQLSDLSLQAIGHRVVHGGRTFFEPVIINDTVMQKLMQLISLAPLHLPHNLDAIKIVAKLFPQQRQVACFDTAFHRTQEPIATLFAIPRQFTAEGIIRYGFHGLSYEYIADILPQYMGEKSQDKVIVAHLGSGASLCAMYKGKSVATSMGFTALDGLMMSRRCGHIDPGVLLYFLQEKHMSVEQLTHLLYEESGLLGVSGISSDMRDLIQSDDSSAKEAVDLFCYRAALEISALCMPLQGCDAIIFTAGIGENSAAIREKICKRLAWLEIKLEEAANANHAVLISRCDSKIPIYVIPTHEEYMIARHTRALISGM